MKAKAVQVSWVEHYSDDGEETGGWGTKKAVKKLARTTATSLETVAWLLKETKTHWILTETYTPDGTYGRIWAIAKGVSKIRKLK